MIRMLRVVALSGIACLVLSIAAEAAAAAPRDWPGWQGPNRDRKSPDKGLFRQWPEGGPRLLWQVDSVGQGFSSTAVCEGRVYTTGDAGGKLLVFAFDLAGKPVWKIEHDASWPGGPEGSRSTPVISGGKLYIESGHGLVGCYDAKKGERRWTRKLSEFGGGVPGWGYSESVLIHGNMAVVTPGGKNCIVALNKDTGETIWMSRGFEGGAQYGSPIALTFQGVTMIATGTGSGIVGVDARTGEALWSNGFSTGNTANCPTPAYADGRVFWANGYGQGGICLELSMKDGKPTASEAWRTGDMDCHHGGYVIEAGHIYGNNGGGWACLDLKTGKRLWQERAVGKGSLCWADGMLFLFGESGGLAGLAQISPQGLTMKGQVRVKGDGPSWAHPVVAGGRLYLRYDKNLYCFDVKAKS